jgi:Sulfotransferase family
MLFTIVVAMGVYQSQQSLHHQQQLYQQNFSYWKIEIIEQQRSDNHLRSSDRPTTTSTNKVTVVPMESSPTQPETIPNAVPEEPSISTESSASVLATPAAVPPSADIIISTTTERTRTEPTPQIAAITSTTSSSSPTSTRRTLLEFVHIPKTGGTAIEYAASLVNITWGLCHWKARPMAGPGCQVPDWKWPNNNKNNNTLLLLFQKSLAQHQVEPSWELWHTPPSWLLPNRKNEEEEDAKEKTVEPSPYQNKTLFAIVRNPYERFISEYYCPYNGLNPVDWTLEDSEFIDPMGTSQAEAFAAQALKKTTADSAANNNNNKKRIKTPETPKSLNEFLMERLRYPVKWTAHYVPQSEYIYDDQGRQLVQHVLRYENLAQEFQSLMTLYEYPVILNSTINNQRHKDPLATRMTIHDLDPATIRRINQVARRDFELLRYPMLNPDEVQIQRHTQQQVQRIYYINLQQNVQRRDYMEAWLSQQPIPYQRINATMGNLTGEDCVPTKENPIRCRGIAGLTLTELDIMDHYNTTGGLTIVLEDDFKITQPVQTMVDATLRWVPSDWDVIRWDCWGVLPPSFDVLVPGGGGDTSDNNNNNPKVFRTVHRRPCNSSETNNEPPCWFAGGTHAMMWRPESVSKLQAVWSPKPYNDIDSRLTTESLQSYCVNNMNMGELDQSTDSDIPKIPS